MPLYPPFSEAPEKRVHIILLYGQGGVWKTSMSLTAQNAAHIDWDRGSAQRAVGIVEAWKFFPDSWKEFRDEIKAHTFDPFNVLILDTVKTAVDNFLVPDVMETHPNLLEATGVLSSKGYSAVNKEWKDVVNSLDGKVLLLIAHRKEVEEGGMVGWRPDIGGQIYQMITGMADQIGYVTREGDDVVIQFSGDRVIWKDTANLRRLVVPHQDDPAWPTFIQDALIQPTIIATSMAAKKTAAEQRLAEAFQVKIDAIKTLDDLNTFVPREEAGMVSKALKILVGHALNKKAEQMGFVLDKNTKLYVPAPAPTKTETPPAAVDRVIKKKTMPAPEPVSTPSKTDPE